ncbi:hypothetical protein BH10CYA1_BH10CYA1_52090 [soil metagenome]
MQKVNPGNCKATSQRISKGSTLALISAVGLIVVGLIFFCLNYARLLGSNAEQKKAIEAAALAAASDLSSIVIPTAEFGYVSLSDQAPIGKATVAGDQYYLPVRGVNTIIGTARVDAIIGSELYKIDASPVWIELVQLDLDNTKSVINQLSAVLTAACTKTGSPKALDRDSKKIDVYQDAQNAYIQNAIRMSGSSSYVPNSLVLSVGELANPAETNTPVPQPSGTYPVAANLQQDNQYKSYVNIPVTTPNGTMNFVFGGIGASNRLIDVKEFVSSAPGVDYHVPAIVKAEADQIIKTSQTPNGATFHSAACAQPSSVFDVRPAPGAIAIEFPDGALPTFTTPSSLLTSAYMNGGDDCDALSAVNDYPTDPGASLDGSCPAWPATVTENKIADAWRVTLYDWIRRGGVRANVTDVVSSQKTAFNPPIVANIDWITELTTTPLTNTNLTALVSGPQIPFGIMHIYKFDQNGSVAYKSQPVAPYPYEVVADKQIYAEKLGKDKGPPATADFVMPAALLPVLTFSNVTLPDLGNGGGGNGSGKPGKKKPPGSPIPGGDIIFTDAIDVYVRDQCRVLTVEAPEAGKHGGEPLNNTLVALNQSGQNHIAALSRITHDYGAGGAGAKGKPSGNKGGGANPLLNAQSDFGDTIAPAEPTLAYQNNAGAPTVRPTYEKTGLTGSIRFRRQIKATGQVLDALTGIFASKSDIGYVGAKTGGAIKTYYTPSSDTTTVTNDLGDK